MQPEYIALPEPEKFSLLGEIVELVCIGLFLAFVCVAAILASGA